MRFWKYFVCLKGRVKVCLNMKSLNMNGWVFFIINWVLGYIKVVLILNINFYFMFLIEI